MERKRKATEQQIHAGQEKKCKVQVRGSDRFRTLPLGVLVDVLFLMLDLPSRVQLGITCWVMIDVMQLGRLSTVPGIHTAKAIDCKNSFTMVLLVDGTVSAFGWTDGWTHLCAPARLSPICEASAVACGLAYGVALLGNGSILVCGNNSMGQHGTGSTQSDPHDLISVPAIRAVRAVACGASYTVALLYDGSVVVFGSNSWGELGIGVISTRVTIPVPVPNIRNVREVACGSIHTILLLNDGTLRAFGANFSGQLGDGTGHDRCSPVTVPNITNARAVACGTWHTVVLLADGTLRAFGDNGDGQLGDGSRTNRNSPVVVTQSGPNIRAVACGGGHTVVINSDGSVSGWGRNEEGQLPQVHDHIESATAVSCGTDTTVVLLANGTLRAFGDNRFGQLGNESHPYIRGRVTFTTP